MPRPPILPLVDWRGLFARAKTYDAWLEAAESAEHRELMEGTRRRLELTPQELGWLGALARPVHVIAIAEDWCGDVVRHMPVLARLAEAAPMLRVRCIARADAPEIFIRFLTNGGEAIPKFIFLNEEFVECGNWGPMPEDCRELIARGKASGDVASARRQVSALYQADESQRIVIRELLHRVDVAATQKIN